MSKQGGCPILCGLKAFWVRYESGGKDPQLPRATINHEMNGRALKDTSAINMSTSEHDASDIPEGLSRRMQGMNIDNTDNREESSLVENDGDNDRAAENEQGMTHLVSGESSSLALDHAQINGSREGDAEVSRYVNCPSYLVGKLIGKGGETIQAIQNSTNTRIQIDQSILESDEKRVEVRGQYNACSEALSIINQIMEGKKPSEINGLAEVTQIGSISGSGNYVQKILYCPPKLIGRLIGKKGETVKSIQKSSGAYISIQQQGVPENELRPISIRGPYHAVNQAAKHILEMVLSSPGVSLTNLKASLIMPCPVNMIGRLIGKGGETIKGLENQSNTKIQVDQAPGNPMINISGTPLALDIASQLIFAILGGLNASMVAQSGASYANSIYTGYPAYRYGYFGGVYGGIVPGSIQFPATFPASDQTSLHSLGTHGSAIATLGTASPIQYYIPPPIPAGLSASTGQIAPSTSQTAGSHWLGS